MRDPEVPEPSELATSSTYEGTLRKEAIPERITDPEEIARLRARYKKLIGLEPPTPSPGQREQDPSVPSINFPCTPRIVDLVRDIAAHMVILFDISLVEATGRVNRFWQGNAVQDRLDEDILLREGPEYWAKTIYYGSRAMWWLGEEGLEPTPYP